MRKNPFPLITCFCLLCALAVLLHADLRADEPAVKYKYADKNSYECLDPVRKSQLKEFYGIICPEEEPEDKDASKAPKPFVRTLQQRDFIVADEPVQVTFELTLPYDAHVINPDYAQGLVPFTLIKKVQNQAVSVPSLRDMAMTSITLTLSLPASQPEGTYTIAPLKFRYERQEARDDKELPGERPPDLSNSVYSSTIKMEKVPLFVEVQSLHDRGLIGGEFPVSIILHARPDTIVINECPQDNTGDGRAYLCQYKPPDPWILLSTQRRESRAETWRIVSWNYVLSPQDLPPDNEELELPLPPVVWRISGQDETHTIHPDALMISLASIVSPPHAMSTPKGLIPMNRPVDRNERLHLQTFPRAILIVLIMISLAFAALEVRALLMRRRVRQASAGTTAEEGPHHDHWDRWPHQRKHLQTLLHQAMQAYQAAPSLELAVRLRPLLARKAAISGTASTLEIPIEEACAMTASELERLAGSTAEVRSLQELDRQLETLSFTALPDTAAPEARQS